MSEMEMMPLYQPQIYQVQLLNPKRNEFGLCTQEITPTAPALDYERYSNHISLDEIGVQGQERLFNGSALVVGLGSAGCPVASCLVAAGIGHIGLVDYGIVNTKTVHLQSLFNESYVGMHKADCAANLLRLMNSNVRLSPYNTQIDSSNALDIVENFDVVIDCTHDAQTRYLLNDACVLNKIPLLTANLSKFHGSLSMYAYRGKETNNFEGIMFGPCYRCVHPQDTELASAPKHVFHPLAGVMAFLLAGEAIKFLAGMTHKCLLVGRALSFDSLDPNLKESVLQGRSNSCPVCAGDPHTSPSLDYLRPKPLEDPGSSPAELKMVKDLSRLLTKKLNCPKRTEQKEKRMSGQPYFGFRKIHFQDEDKTVWVQDVPKGERKLGPSCKSDYCAKGISRRCTEFTEEKRQQIFSDFWNVMDWNQKRNYVKSLVESVPVKRRRAKFKTEVSRKGDSKLYHLILDTERVPVCRLTFLNTLGVREAMVRWWLSTENQTKKNKKRRPLKAENVDEYVNSLPKIPPKCQFCQSFSTKLYIDGAKNLNQLFGQYVKDMRSQGVTPASRKTFTKVLNSKNLGIFKPKNDHDICDNFSAHNQVHFISSSDVSYQGLDLNSINNIDLQISQPSDSFVNQTFANSFPADTTDMLSDS